MNSTTATPSFTPDVAGTYTLQLLVNDGTVSSAPDVALILTAPGNTTPIANAGPDQSLPVGATAELDGAASHDPDGDALTFAWSLLSMPAASHAVLSNPASLAPTFLIDAAGTYVVQLTVGDGKASASDTVVVSTVNSRPVADAGSDQGVHTGATAHLDGSRSHDADGDVLTFRWSLINAPAGSTAHVSDSTAISPTLVADKTGLYTAQLIVNDGHIDSAAATTNVTAANHPPIARDDSATTPASTAVTIAVLTNDADGDGDTVSVTSVTQPTSGTVTFTSTSVQYTPPAGFSGSASFAYTISDGVDSASATVVVDVLAPPLTNHPPVANAGPDVAAGVGDSVALNGTGSSDPDGDALAYGWLIQSGPSGGAGIADASSGVAHFQATTAGTYVVELTVTDSAGASATDTATVVVSDAPVAPEFTFALVDSAPSVFADSSALVRFSVTNRRGFTSPVTVGLVNPPPGVSADAVDQLAGIADGSLVVEADATLAVGQVSLVVSASAAGVTHTVPLTLTVRAPEPRAQEKIEAALVAGTLDRSTSLLYRAYALVGDPRLPAEFQGSGSTNEDGSLFSEIIAALPTASPGVRAQLEPFTLRPANPNSWYGQLLASLPAAQGALVAQKAPAARAVRTFAAMTSQVPGDVLPSSCLADTTATGGWISKRGSSSHMFRVWVHCGEDASQNPATDAAFQGIIDRVVGIFDTIWPDMTAPTNGGMGDPLPDTQVGAPVNPADGVGDETIDIYLTLTGDVVRRLTEAQSGVKHAYGWAIPTSGNRKSSGFITLPLNLTNAGALQSTAIHEFFHVLQFAHNNDLANAFVIGGTGGPGALTRSWWYVEASATWAEAHFDRTISGLPQGRLAYGQVYGPWFAGRNAAGGFQKRTPLQSLNTPERQPYEAFIWPYFMEQRGSATKPAQVWSAVEGASDPKSADEAMNGIFSFKTEFREFSKRDLNRALNPGDALPRSDRFVNLDGAQFGQADGVEPVVTTMQLALGTNAVFPVNVAPLAAQHAKFDVSDNRIRQIVFDLSALSANRDALGLDLDAFEKINGSWKARDLNGETKLTYCLDDANQKLESLRLVISNHTMSGETAASGFLITVSAAPCKVQWVGTAVFDTQYKLFPNTHIKTTANVTWIRDETYPLSIVGIDAFKPSGSGSIDLFEANGCVATVIPSTGMIDSISGNMTIDYNSTPNVVDGYGSISVVATIVDCQGREQPGTPLGITYMVNGPLELNDKGDELIKHVVLADDQSSLMTLDLSYKRFLVP